MISDDKAKVYELGKLHGEAVVRAEKAEDALRAERAKVAEKRVRVANLATENIRLAAKLKFVEEPYQARIAELERQLAEADEAIYRMVRVDPSYMPEASERAIARHKARTTREENK